MFDFDDGAALTHHLLVVGVDGADRVDVEGEAVAAGETDGHRVVVESKLTLRPRGVLLDDAADDRPVFDENHLVVQRSTAVLRLEIGDGLGVDENDVVADFERCGGAGIDALGEALVAVVGHHDSGVGNRLLAAVGREHESLAGQHDSTRPPVGICDGLAVLDDVAVIARRVDQFPFSLAHDRLSWEGSGLQVYKHVRLLSQRRALARGLLPVKF